MTVDTRPRDAGFGAEAPVPGDHESARRLDAPALNGGSGPTWADRGWRGLATRLAALEPFLVPPSALVLLFYPNPLALPAAILGVLPSFARLLLTGHPWRPTPFDLPLALLTLGALLGGLASLHRDAALIRLAGLLAGLILFGATHERIRSARTARGLVLGLLALATLACVALLVVVAPFLPLDRVPPLAALVGALDRWEIGQRLMNEDWLLQRYRFRASGVGAMAAVGLALVVAMLAGSRSRRALAPLALLSAFFLLVLVAADNRGAMLAAVVTVGATAAVWKRRLLLLAPLGGIAVALVLASRLGDRGLSFRTLGQRLWFWEDALYLARELPITGAGLGLDSVRLTYQAYFQPVYPPFSHAHNIYLQGLLEYGAFGLLGLVGLVTATLWLGWRRDRTAEGGSDPWLVAGRMAGFGIAFAMLAAGASEIAALTTFGGAMLLGAAGLLAGASSPATGLLAGAATPATSTRPDPATRTPDRARTVRPSRTTLLASAAALVLFVAVVFGGWAQRAAAVVLLDLGTAELNRGTISEWIGKDEATAAVDRAHDLLDRAASLDPANPTIHRNLALALAARNEERPARDALDRARALLDPEASTARRDLFQIGRAFVAVNAWTDAIRAWQAAEAAPQLLQLGSRLLTRSRNYGQATAAYTAAATVEPDSRAAYDGIAQAAEGRGGSADDVVRALAPMVERGGVHEYMARLEIARTYRDAGRLADAAESLRAAQQAHGSSPDISFEYGVIMALGERWEAAERSLTGVPSSRPLAGEHWSWLAYAQLRLGRPADALATVEQGFANADLERRADRLALQTVRAETLLALGRPSEARVAFDEAQATRSGDARVRDGLARVAARSGGAEPELVTNGSFAWDGGWAVRERGRATGALVSNERPLLTDGVLRVIGNDAAEYVAAQEVWGLEPGARYRLRARARRDGADAGAASVEVVGGTPAVGLGGASTTTSDWSTLDLTFQAVSRSATIEVSVGERGRQHVALFDEVSLVRVAPAR